jgi:hypothetical protein
MNINKSKKINRRHFLKSASAGIAFFSIAPSSILSLNTTSGLSDASATIPRQVVLTWQHCPQTAITITWRTDKNVSSPKVLYGLSECASDYCEALGTSLEFDNQLLANPKEAWINAVELTGLQPDTEYHVIIPHKSNPEKFKFRTAGESANKTVFVAFADTHFATQEGFGRCKSLFEKIAQENPDFCLGVGDFWYVEGGHDVVDLWFDAWDEKMIATDGRRIPLIPAEGNHDRVRPQSDQDRTPAKSTFFYQRFKLPESQTHFVTQYGPELTVITLNSNHSEPIEKQTQWLEQTLKEHQNSGWLIVQHHVGPYPGYKTIASREKANRKHWVPLYEKYGVDLVISGHDHTYLQTHPIKDDIIDHEQGIVYIITNGCGGPRQPDMMRWYINEAASQLAYWRLTISEKEGVSTLRAVPVFPFDASYSGQPYVLAKDKHGNRISPSCLLEKAS